MANGPHRPLVEAAEERRKRREILTRNQDAAIALDRLGIIIDIAEGTTCSYAVATRIVNAAKKEQQRLLKIIDKTAAELGAPFPGNT